MFKGRKFDEGQIILVLQRDSLVSYFSYQIVLGDFIDVRMIGQKLLHVWQQHMTQKQLNNLTVGLF
jgi:hypothetical protein